MSDVDENGNPIPDGDEAAAAAETEADKEFEAGWAELDGGGAEGDPADDPDKDRGGADPGAGDGGGEDPPDKDPPSAEADAGAGDGQPDKEPEKPDPMKDAPPWATAFSEGLDKLNRDTRSMLGRLDSRLSRVEQGGGGRPADAGGGGSRRWLWRRHRRGSTLTLGSRLQPHGRSLLLASRLTSRP